MTPGVRRKGCGNSFFPQPKSPKNRLCQRWRKILSHSANIPPAAEAAAATPSIVILDRGFVLVGHAVVEGEWVTTTQASIVRRWGTTKGLGELAAPQAAAEIADMMTTYLSSGSSSSSSSSNSNIRK